MSDALLIELCKQNNRQAQLTLYDKYYKGMFAVACRYLSQSDAAEDAMQDSFIKAFQKLSQYNGEVTFGSWLKRIVINTCLDELKARKLETEEISDASLMAVYDDSIEVEEDVTVDQIKQALEMLTGIKKTILKLFCSRSMICEEISEILAISISASRTYLHRGKKELLDQLKGVVYERC